MVYQNIKKFNGNKSTAPHPFGQQKIVMLTDIIENDESKCAIYFPQNIGKVTCFLSQWGRRHKDSQTIYERLESYYNQCEHWPELQTNDMIEIEWIDSIPEINFNFFCIKHIGILNKSGYTIRKLHCLYIVCDGTSNKHIYQFVAYHYWFPHWPDHRSPENIDVVLDMCIDLLDSDCEDDFQRTNSAHNNETATTDEASEMNKTILRRQSTTSIGQIYSNSPMFIIHW